VAEVLIRWKSNVSLNKLESKLKVNGSGQRSPFYAMVNRRLEDGLVGMRSEI
jgi:hypothetical protein